MFRNSHTELFVCLARRQTACLLIHAYTYIYKYVHMYSVYVLSLYISYIALTYALLCLSIVCDTAVSFIHTALPVPSCCLSCARTSALCAYLYSTLCCDRAFSVLCIDKVNAFYNYSKRARAECTRAVYIGLCTLSTSEGTHAHTHALKPTAHTYIYAYITHKHTAMHMNLYIYIVSLKDSLCSNV